jgi:hypothetical protein
LCSPPDASPARDANHARNRQTARARRRRWAPVRAAAWALIDRHLRPGDRVAIVGAGNGDDLPLRQIARRAAAVDLIDLDADALRRARRRTGVRRRRHVRPVVLDVTGGAADAVIRGERRPAVPAGPLGDAPYDLVIADLLYTQLVYPALLDRGVETRRIAEILRTDGQRLTDAVAERVRASAAGGRVLHLNDVLGWWEGHDQPFTLDELMAVQREDPAEALAMTHRGVRPRGANVPPREPIETALWPWPFAPGIDYVVLAAVEAGPTR